jgi:type VI secretion system secreted protein Hcp
MAQSDFFLKLDGVIGESEDAKHAKEMQIESWSLGATNSGSMGQGTGGGSGKVSMQDFHFVVKNGLSSPKLFEKCSTGEHIASGTLTCRKAGTDPQDYLIVKFTDIIVSSYHIGGSGGSEMLPMDQISFNFTKIEYTYKPQDAKGSLGGNVAFGYDVKKNQKV